MDEILFRKFLSTILYIHRDNGMYTTSDGGIHRSEWQDKDHLSTRGIEQRKGDVL